MANEINRREALSSILIAAAAMQLGPFNLARAQKLEQPIEIIELVKLEKDWDAVTSKIGNENATLVRVPKPSDADLADGLKSGRWSQTGNVILTAFTMTCTHEGCDVSAPNEKHEMGCGCHGSTFNALDGRVTKGPASSALKGVKLEVKGGKVWAVGTFD